MFLFLIFVVGALIGVYVADKLHRGTWFSISIALFISILIHYILIHFPYFDNSAFRATHIENAQARDRLFMEISIVGAILTYLFNKSKNESPGQSK